MTKQETIQKQLEPHRKALKGHYKKLAKQFKTDIYEVSRALNGHNKRQDIRDAAMIMYAKMMEEKG